MRQEAELTQSRLENDELEAKLQEKVRNKEETIEKSLAIQKEYEKQSEELSNLRQMLAQENLRRQKIADELEESRRMGRQPRPSPRATK